MLAAACWTIDHCAPTPKALCRAACAPTTYLRHPLTPMRPTHYALLFALLMCVALWRIYQLMTVGIAG